MPHPLLHRVHGCTKRSAPRGVRALQATVRSTWQAPPGLQRASAAYLEHLLQGTLVLAGLFLSFSTSLSAAVTQYFFRLLNLLSQRNPVCSWLRSSNGGSLGASGAGCVHRNHTFSPLQPKPCYENSVQQEVILVFLNVFCSKRMQYWLPCLFLCIFLAIKVILKQTGYLS